MRSQGAYFEGDRGAIVLYTMFLDSCITSPIKFFGETSNHSGDSAPLQPTFSALRLLAFPKTKITFEKEEISDHDKIQENTRGQLMTIGRAV